MASEISHVVYANNFLKKKPIAGDVYRFFAGVLFPDIRYVSNVSRSQTHNNFEELDLRFDGMDDFEKGWKFHVWCDMRRNELLRDKGFFEMKEVQRSHYQSNYLLEDSLVWGEFEKWDFLSSFLREFPYIDLFDELNESDWSFWYSDVLAEYFKEKPNEEIALSLLKKIPSVGSRGGEIVEGMGVFRKNKKISKVLSELHLEMV